MKLTPGTCFICDCEVVLAHKATKKDREIIISLLLQGSTNLEQVKHETNTLSICPLCHYQLELVRNTAEEFKGDLDCFGRNSCSLCNKPTDLISLGSSEYFQRVAADHKLEDEQLVCIACLFYLHFRHIVKKKFLEKCPNLDLWLSPRNECKIGSPKGKLDLSSIKKMKPLSKENNLKIYSSDFKLLHQIPFVILDLAQYNRPASRPRIKIKLKKSKINPLFRSKKSTVKWNASSTAVGMDYIDLTSYESVEEPRKRKREDFEDEDPGYMKYKRGVLKETGISYEPKKKKKRVSFKEEADEIIDSYMYDSPSHNFDDDNSKVESARPKSKAKVVKNGSSPSNKNRVNFELVVNLVNLRIPMTTDTDTESLGTVEPAEPDQLDDLPSEENEPGTLAEQDDLSNSKTPNNKETLESDVELKDLNDVHTTNKNHVLVTDKDDLGSDTKNTDFEDGKGDVSDTEENLARTTPECEMEALQISDDSNDTGTLNHITNERKNSLNSQDEVETDNMETLGKAKLNCDDDNANDKRESFKQHAKRRSSVALERSEVQIDEDEETNVDKESEAKHKEAEDDACDKENELNASSSTENRKDIEKEESRLQEPDKLKANSGDSESVEDLTTELELIRKYVGESVNDIEHETNKENEQGNEIKSSDKEDVSLVGMSNQDNEITTESNKANKIIPSDNAKSNNTEENDRTDTKPTECDSQNEENVDGKHDKQSKAEDCTELEDVLDLGLFDTSNSD